MEEPPKVVVKVVAEADSVVAEVEADTTVAGVEAGVATGVVVVVAAEVEAPGTVAWIWPSPI